MLIDCWEQTHSGKWICHLDGKYFIGWLEAETFLLRLGFGKYEAYTYLNALPVRTL